MSDNVRDNEGMNSEQHPEREEPEMTTQTMVWAGGISTTDDPSEGLNLADARAFSTASSAYASLVHFAAEMCAKATALGIDGGHFATPEYRTNVLEPMRASVAFIDAEIASNGDPVLLGFGLPMPTSAPLMFWVAQVPLDAMIAAGAIPEVDRGLWEMVAA